MTSLTAEFRPSSLRNYLGAANVLAGFMKIVNGAELPQTTKDKWVALMWSMRVADDLIDNEQSREKRQEMYQYVVERLSCKTPPSKVEGPTNEVISVIENDVIHELPSSRQNLFVTNLSSLFHVTEALKTETDGKKLADLTRLEGQLTARMLLLALPEEHINRKSNIAVTRFCRFANNIDSAVDMPRDHRKGEIVCEPSIENMATMFVAAIPDIVSSISNLRPGFTEALQMIDCAFQTFSGLNRD